ncbi:hypothetical protein V5799_005152, partial [Amblyomma americanum]
MMDSLFICIISFHQDNCMLGQHPHSFMCTRPNWILKNHIPRHGTSLYSVKILLLFSCHVCFLQKKCVEIKVWFINCLPSVLFCGITSISTFVLHFS